MTQTLADESAEALAAQWNAEADAHEQRAAQTPDRFQAAAFLGLAEDLRARAAQTLSETMAGRRLAEQEAERAALLAAAQAAHHDAVARYRELAGQVPDLIDTTAAEVLAAAKRIRAHAVELADAQAEAEATRWGVNANGGHAPAVANFHDALIRELMADDAGPARVWNAARTSAVSCAKAVGERASYLGALEGPTDRGRV